ncbi:hypothetical protein J4E89_010350 [Alternaria sp. Ai002NY15]|nr:hypothetical protein J4E89_010350 [Alternaria sp. Ai002NY15]
MTEVGHHRIEQSPAHPLPPQPSAPTKSDPIDTSSLPNQHEEIRAPLADDRPGRKARLERIPEDDNPGKDVPTRLRMAMFTAVVVWVILACYEGISYILGAHLITAALATFWQLIAKIKARGPEEE